MFWKRWQVLNLKLSLSQLILWLLYGCLTAFFSSAYAFLIGPTMKSLWVQERVQSTQSNTFIEDLTQIFKVRLGLENTILILACILLSTILLKNLFSFLYRLTESNWINQILDQMQRQIFEALLQKDIDTLWQLENENLEQVLMQKRHEIGQGLKQASSMVKDGLQVLCLLLVAFWIYPQFLIALLLIYPIFFLPMRYLSALLKKSIKLEHEKQQRMSIDLMYWFKDLVLLRTHFKADHETLAFDTEHSNTKTLIYLETFSPLINELSVAIVLIAILQYQQNQPLALDQITSFLICILMLYQPLKQIAVHLPQLLKLNLDFQILEKILSPPLQKPWDDRFFKMVDDIDSDKVHGDKVHGDKVHGDKVHREVILRIDQLSVDRMGQSVLSNLSIDIYANHCYLIQGENGSGKSTLFLTLLGLLPIKNGQVILSKKTSLITTWDQVFSISFQEGKVRQSQQKGSGGQKKKLDLMRAFLQERPILLLDEPEVFLDTINQDLLFETLKAKKGKQTILMISHDPKWWALADHIIQLKDMR